MYLLINASILKCFSGLLADQLSSKHVAQEPFNKLTFTKELLKTKHAPDIAFKEDDGFPHIQYPSSIFDFNTSPQYYHNVGYSITEIDPSNNNKTQPSTCENILQNYKRKQKLRDMNMSMKKVFNKTLSFDDYDRPINISQNIPQKMIKVHDDLIISKFINKKPFNFCEYVVEDVPEAPVRTKLQNQIIINKFINKKPWMSPEARKQEQFKKYSNLLSIVDDLIAICEHIFNGLIAYVYENYGDFILVPHKEANEILEIVDKLKQVLDILDFLSANIVLEYVEFSKEYADTPAKNSKELKQTSLSSVESTGETIAVYSSPTIHIVDEAINTIELLLKSALPNTNSTKSNPEETKEIMVRLDSLKNILGTLEKMNASEQQLQTTSELM